MAHGQTFIILVGYDYKKVVLHVHKK